MRTGSGIQWKRCFNSTDARGGRRIKSQAATLSNQHDTTRSGIRLERLGYLQSSGVTSSSIYTHDKVSRALNKLAAHQLFTIRSQIPASSSIFPIRGLSLPRNNPPQASSPAFPSNPVAPPQRLDISSLGLLCLFLLSEHRSSRPDFYRHRHCCVPQRLHYSHPLPAPRWQQRCRNGNSNLERTRL